MTTVFSFILCTNVLCKLVQPSLKIALQYLQKLNIGPNNFTQQVSNRNAYICLQKDAYKCITCIICNSQKNWKRLKCINSRID